MKSNKYYVMICVFVGFSSCQSSNNIEISQHDIDSINAKMDSMVEIQVAEQIREMNRFQDSLQNSSNNIEIKQNKSGEYSGRVKKYDGPTLSDWLNEESAKLPESGILQDIYTPQEQAKRYSSSGFFNPLLDNEAIAASNQTTISKLKNGLKSISNK